MLGVVHEVTLWVHVAAGAVALVAGLVAIATEKGGRRHRRAGRGYALSMGVVVTTAVPLALADANYFLLTVAVFSGYLVLMGYRVLGRKRPSSRAAPLDWVAHLTMAGFGVGMVALGGADLLAGDGLGAALVVFGGIGLALACRELWRVFRPPDDPRTWFYRHVVYMGGAYIATVTAAVTVNLAFLPPLVRWVGPTAVGTPLLVALLARYRRKFERAGPTAVAE